MHQKVTPIHHLHPFCPTPHPTQLPPHMRLRHKRRQPQRQTQDQRELHMLPASLHHNLPMVRLQKPATTYTNLTCSTTTLAPPPLKDRAFCPSFGNNPRPKHKDSSHIQATFDPPSRPHASDLRRVRPSGPLLSASQEKRLVHDATTWQNQPNLMTQTFTLQCSPAP